jgi:uncharacterized damage-inducible protein DinB
MNNNNMNRADWLEMENKLAIAEKEFLQIIEKLDEELRDKEIDEGKWSPKDILSHIVGWEVEVVKQFKAILTNPDVDDNYDIDSFNKSAVESRKHLSWDQIVTELKTAQAELSSFLSNLTQKEIDKEKRFVEWVDVLINHYTHHTKQLKQLT